MKHTIKGKHGHMFRLFPPAERKPGEFYKTERICVSAQEIADADYMVGKIRLREKLSLKWDVCMGCWSPGPKNGLYSYRGGKEVLVGKECDRCASGHDVISMKKRTK